MKHMDRRSRATVNGPEEAINLGKWTERGLDRLIKASAEIDGPSARIGALSHEFLGTEYGEATLLGGKDSPEVLVINLERVDCFTFIDYVEAMRLSRTFGEFRKNLIRVRYRYGTVSYLNRNHFFTDWVEFNRERVRDATGAVGRDKAEQTVKTLNLTEKGTLVLEGLAPRTREITFIASRAVDESVLMRLKTGDYAGIYTERAGLDVSHVGIIIKDKGMTRLRHASSLQSYRRVIDQDLKEYLADKPGLVVLRPKG